MQSNSKHAMHKAYRQSIRYAVIYICAILASGGWLITLEHGWHERWIQEGVLGLVRHADKVGLHRFLEVSAPHIIGMGTALFIIAHFLPFTDRVAPKRALQLVTMLFIATLVNLAAYLPAVLGLGIVNIKPLAVSVYLILFSLILVPVWLSL